MWWSNMGFCLPVASSGEECWSCIHSITFLEFCFVCGFGIFFFCACWFFFPWAPYFPLEFLNSNYKCYGSVQRQRTILFPGCTLHTLAFFWGCTFFVLHLLHIQKTNRQVTTIFSVLLKDKMFFRREVGQN